MINTERFVKGVSVKPSTTLSTTSVNIATATGYKYKNYMIVFEVISGNVWLEFDSVATASTGFLVTNDTGALHLTVGENLSIISDSSEAEFQVMVVKSTY